MCAYSLLARLVQTRTAKQLNLKHCSQLSRASLRSGGTICCFRAVAQCQYAPIIRFQCRNARLSLWHENSGDHFAPISLLLVAAADSWSFSWSLPLQDAKLNKRSYSCGCQRCRMPAAVRYALAATAIKFSRGRSVLANAVDWKL